MKTRTVQGYYGSGNTACDVFCVDYDGGTWYAVDGSVNVNFTLEPVELGVNVEMLSDVDCFTWADGINSESELLQAVEA